MTREWARRSGKDTESARRARPRSPALSWILALAVWAGSVPALAGPVVQLEVDGPIGVAVRDYVSRGMEVAEASAAEILLIQLNTPGGFSEATRDIVEAELSSQIPIIVYVGPAGARAASAGVLITLAADVAVMAPGTNIGAAHPVSLFGGGSDDGTAGPSAAADKVTNDAAAFARSVAQQRGRNADWAESAVRASSALSSSEALQLGVIDRVAADVTTLLHDLDGYVLRDGRILRTQDRPIHRVAPTLRERVLSWLSDPNLVYVLFIVGLISLGFELLHPGIGFGLAAGVVCLSLSLFGLQLLPVNALGVVLVLFGFVLVVLDAFAPTHGALTIGGILSLGIGSLTLFDIPDPGIGLSIGTIVAVLGAVLALSLFVLSKGLSIQRRRPVMGRGALVGAAGTVREALTPHGTVFVRGEYWSARTEGERLPVGTAVEVTRVDGGTLVVRRV